MTYEGKIAVEDNAEILFRFYVLESCLVHIIRTFLSYLASSLFSIQRIFPDEILVENILSSRTGYQVLVVTPQHHHLFVSP